MLKRRVPTWVAGAFLALQVVFLVLIFARTGGFAPGNILGLIVGAIWFFRSRARDQEEGSSK